MQVEFSILNQSESMNYNDEEVVCEIVNGSEKAFCFLYEKYFSSLNRFSFHIVMREESKDIVHDIFSKLWENRKSLPKDINIKSYLYTAIKNRSLDYLKHNGIKDKNQKKLIEALIFIQESWREEEDERLFDKLMSCVEKLPQQQFKIVKLKIEGKSYQEISDELNISTRTVNSHMMKIYNFIRDNLHFITLLTINL